MHPVTWWAFNDELQKMGMAAMPVPPQQANMTGVPTQPVTPPVAGQVGAAAQMSLPSSKPPAMPKAGKPPSVSSTMGSSTLPQPGQASPTLSGGSSRGTPSAGTTGKVSAPSNAGAGKAGGGFSS